MGFTEQRGGWWLVVRSEMRAFNGTEPELMQDERNRFVQVTFRPRALGSAGSTC